MDDQARREEIKKIIFDANSTHSIDEVEFLRLMDITKALSKSQQRWKKGINLWRCECGQVISQKVNRRWFLTLRNVTYDGLFSVRVKMFDGAGSAEGNKLIVIRGRCLKCNIRHDIYINNMDINSAKYYEQHYVYWWLQQDCKHRGTREPLRAYSTKNKRITCKKKSEET